MRGSYFAKLAVLLIGATMMLTGMASAEYPEQGKVIRMVVPWAPGGSVDVFARLMVPGLEKELGATIEIVNLPGAGAQVGMTEVARSAPDGYTLGVASLPGLQTIYLDPARQAAFNNASFTKITLTSMDPEAIAVKADSPFQSIADLAETARKEPGSIRVAVGGLMGDSHLGGILMEKAIGADVALVTFDGGLTPALTAMLGGHTHAYVGAPPSIAAVAQAGDIRVIGMMSEERNPLLPDVPTLKELGFENAVMGASRGIVGPAGLPEDIVAKLDAAIQKAMALPEVQASLKNAWSTAVVAGPAEFQSYWDTLDADTSALMKEVGEQ